MRALVLLALVAPVPGDVTRGFDPGRPFEAGRHRGVDLAASPGSPVRAACAGPVAFAGRIGTSGGVVTLRCGPWRVTHMPLATIRARTGDDVARGAIVGSVAASSAHQGLHLGMRRDGTRFGYVDPLRFLARRSPPIPLGRAPRPVGRTSPPARPPAPRVAGPLRAPAPLARHRARVRAPSPTSLPLAPWPAWAGLALVLAGAGVRLRWRRRAAYTNPMARAVER